MSGSEGEASATGQLARALVARLLWFVATLTGAAVFLQVLLWASPGDPIDLLPNGAELRPALEAEWGLDQPLPIRLATSLGHALQGDLGTSLSVRPGADVAELLAPALARSAALLLPGLLLGLGAALLLATWTTGRKSAVRTGIELLSVAPVFLLAYLLVVGLNDLTWQLIEADRIARPGWFALPDQASGLRSALAIGVLAVGSSSLTEQHAACEDELGRLRQSGFIEAARARGAAVWPHLVWNLVAPLTTLATSRIAFLLGSLVILEKILLMNGAGALLWEACLQRDYPLAMGISLAAALVVCLARLLGDILKVVVDPRLRGRST